MMRVFRADESCFVDAFAVVNEYYDAIGVIVRDTAEEFRRTYFSAGSGVWLTHSGGKNGAPEIVGCVALRPLQIAGAAEVKRLYVRPAWRRAGAADALMRSLESYAAAYGYRHLYLDSKADLEAALRFYSARGYAPCERYNDNPQATIFLSKSLPATL